jgi:hypothetical protein
MELGSHWTDFHEIWYYRVFLEKLSRKLKFHKIRTRITGTLHGDQQTFLIIFLSILGRMSNISAKFVKELKTHILYSIIFPPRKSCILLDNVEKYCRMGQATGDPRRMRFACWITKAAHVLTIRNTYCFSTATMVARTRLTVTLYVHCLHCCSPKQTECRHSNIYIMLGS